MRDFGWQLAQPTVFLSMLVPLTDWHNFEITFFLFGAKNAAISVFMLVSNYR